MPRRSPVFHGYRYTVGTVGSPYIGECTVFPLDGRRRCVDTWELTDLQVHPACRGRGYAHTLLGKICRWADMRGITIRLYVQPYAYCTTRNARVGLNRFDRDVATLRLLALYRGWGWRVTRGVAWPRSATHVTMRRVPQRQNVNNV